MGQTTSRMSKSPLSQENPDTHVRKHEGAKVQSEKETAQEVPNAGHSHRDLRRFYKVTLAHVFSQWEQDQRIPEQGDCLRCFLAERGALIIRGRPICTCTFPVPEGQVAFTEADLEASGNDNALLEDPGSLWYYMETMALSTAVGATLGSRINLANDPPFMRVVERRVDHEAPVRSTPHNCLKIPRPGTVSPAEIRYCIRGETLLNAKQRYAVVYAAPGFGKTTLQNRLASRGVICADTDDVPGATREHVSELLEWTSVLTNRLELLDPEFPTVVFVPTDAEVLGRRGMVKKLTDEDLNYWCNLHLFPNHRRIVKFFVDRSCLTDWVCVHKWPAPPESRTGPEFEAEFLQKVRDLGGTTQ